MAAWSNYTSDQGWSKCTENLHHWPYLQEEKGRQAGGLEETSTSALCRRDHLSPLVCGAVKILTDACTEGSQRRFKCHSISCYSAIPSQEFMCRIFSSSSLVVSPGICFISEKKKKERKKDKEKKEKRKAQVSNFLCPPNKPQGGL